ncbi:ester cyclase [Photobacterium sp. SDRW27]|uniref:ester cyclase n=1 Tax=Photobacterium obscurum TaxID=2829490 RepID=UPI0022434DF6|nr:ester cyclase [Photobacterium obscurum]MCW8330166.1 ester cyclase [Photobacterium obscurum]
MKVRFRYLLIASLALGLTLNTASASENITELKAKIAELQLQVDAHKAEREQTAKHLATFDELDLEAFNHRDMKRIGEIHADDVIVHNPDGTKTSPFKPHSEELQYLFDVFQFKVTDHIVGFGHGEWTAGISISEGKWVKPLTLPDGTVKQPTGQHVRIKIATIARWKNGRIAEEYLFWDNADWNRQIGLE